MSSVEPGREPPAYKGNNIYSQDMTADHKVTAKLGGWTDAVSKYDSIICWKPN